MDVTDVLRGRMQTPAGLQKMITVSVAVHLAVAAAMIFARGGLLSRHDAPPTLMTISIAGSAGPENGGMTALGGRPVQAVTPPEDVAKREAVRAPAAKTPEMTVPLPNAKTVKATPSVAVKQAPDEARGRTPTKGKEPAFGSAIADTGVRGQGFGLSTGGGGAGSGSSLEITGDFCCPEYLATMIARIRSSWNQNQGARGTSLIRFTIQRDGKITDATIFKPSGTVTLDTAALRAILATRTLPPLPEAIPNPTLTMRLSFEYQ
jgi:periplasmic protein TonB